MDLVAINVEAAASLSGASTRPVWGWSERLAVFLRPVCTHMSDGRSWRPGYLWWDECKTGAATARLRYSVYADAHALRRAAQETPARVPASSQPPQTATMSSSLWAALTRRSTALTSLARRASWRQNTKTLSRRLESTASDSASGSESTQFQLKAKKDSLLSPFMIIVGIVPIFTFALGTWQVQRLKWKVNLIDELQEKLEREPMLLPRQVKCAPTRPYARLSPCSCPYVA